MIRRVRDPAGAVLLLGFTRLRATAVAAMDYMYRIVIKRITSPCSTIIYLVGADYN